MYDLFDLKWHGQCSTQKTDFFFFLKKSQHKIKDRGVGKEKKKRRRCYRFTSKMYKCK